MFKFIRTLLNEDKFGRIKLEEQRQNRTSKSSPQIYDANAMTFIQLINQNIHTKYRRRCRHQRFLIAQIYLKQPWGDWEERIMFFQRFMLDTHIWTAKPVKHCPTNASLPSSYTYIDVYAYERFYGWKQILIREHFYNSKSSPYKETDGCSHIIIYGRYLNGNEFHASRVGAKCERVVLQIVWAWLIRED